jgi:hypothetical protein
MRITSDPRPVGYSIAIVLLLVAPYCALAGSQWIGAAFAGAGALILVLLALTGVDRRDPPGTRTSR